MPEPPLAPGADRRAFRPTWGGAWARLACGAAGLLCVGAAWRGAPAQDGPLLELAPPEGARSLSEPALAVLAGEPNQPGEPEVWLVCIQAGPEGEQVVAAALGAEAPALEPLSAGPGPCLAPALVADGRGGLLAVWSERVDGDFELVARARHDGAWGPAVRVTDEPGGDFGPVLATDPDGRVWLAHEGLRGGRSQVAVRAFEDGAFGPPVTVGDGERSEGQPALGCSADGAVWVAWCSWRGTYADGNYEVAVQRLGSEQPARVLSRPDRADLAPVMAPVKAGAAGLALAWTSAVVRPAEVEPLVASSYDAWEEKLYYVSWLGEAGFGEPVRVSHAPADRRAYDDVLFAVGDPGAAAADAVADGHARPLLLVHDTHDGRRRRLTLARIGAEAQEAGLDASDGLESQAGAKGLAWVGEALWVAENALLGEDERPGIRVRALERARLGRLPEALPSARGRGTGGADGGEPAVPPDLASGRPERPEVEAPPGEGGAAAETWRAWFGNLHLHSNLSRDGAAGDGPPDWNLRALRDVAALDFAALTDHGSNLNAADWRETLARTELWDQPGAFVTLPGYEWSSPRYGHKNVVFRTRAAAAEHVPLSGQDGTPRELFDALTSGEAIAIPHHPSHGAVGATDWSFHDDDLQRQVEIFQKRGSYEYDGAPLQRGRIGNWEFHPGHSVRDALDAGHHLGFIASPDHGGGPGLAGVWAPELERGAVFEALHARRSFATTGAKLALHLTVAGAAQGSAGVEVDPERVEVRGRVFGTRPGLRLVLVSDGEELASVEEAGDLAEIVWTGPLDLARERYVYLRAEQSDGHLGWTSPVWLAAR